MNKTNKLALTVFAVLSMSGCASTQVVELARGQEMQPAPQAQAEPKVSRALQSYGSMGGYRYRRFAAVTVAG